jgi:hypothetical protein
VLNERIERRNADARSYKAAELAHNQTAASFNAECAKRYYADDMNAVRMKLNLQE